MTTPLIVVANPSQALEITDGRDAASIWGRQILSETPANEDILVWIAANSRYEHKQIDELAGGFVNITGDTMTGALNVPTINLGTDPASTGTVNLPNNENISWRNAANAADIRFARLNGADTFLFDPDAAGVSFGGTLTSTGLITATAGITSANPINITSTNALVLGSDQTGPVALSWGAVNRLDLASGDSFNVVSGNVSVGADGSAASPAYRRAATGSGLYFSGNDTLIAAASVLAATFVGADTALAGDLTVAGDHGFYGQAATAKPTGVAVNDAAIHAALVTLNLISA